MSYHFRAYRFPKRDLWHVIETLRSHLASNHRYSIIAQQLSITMYRKILHSGDEHSASCHSRYLGQCNCDFWARLDMMRDYVTSKQKDVHGLEGQLIEYGHDYVMRVCGEHHWVDLFPGDLLTYVGMKELLYFDGADVPSEDRPNKEIADRFDREVRAHRYMMIPLLTVDDVDHMMWQMASYLGRWAWQKRNGVGRCLI